MPNHYLSRPLFLLKHLLLPSIILLLGLTANGQTHQPETFQTDGEVKEVVAYKSKLILGGDFEYAGSNTGSAALLDLNNGTALPLNWPKVYGPINCIADDGSGGYFIGGSFLQIGTTNVKFLAHILANGSLDQSFTPNPNIAVYALHRSGNTLYVGGGFSAISNGQTRQYLAAFHIPNLSLKTWAPAMNGYVYSLKSYKGRVIIGGKFTRANNTFFLGLVSIDSSNTNDMLGFNIARTSTNANDPIIYDLALQNDILYAVGSFRSTDTTFFNGRAWKLMPRVNATHPWRLRTDTTVYSIAVKDSNIWIGGYFKRVNGVARKGVALLDTSVGPRAILRPFNPEILARKNQGNININKVAFVNDKLYVSGSFSLLGGIRKHNNLRFDASTGVLDTAWSFHTNNSSTNFTPIGNNLLVTGYFSSHGGQLYRHIGLLDRTTFTALPTTLTADSTITALQVDGDNLYLGGRFKKLNGIDRPYLGAFNLANGSVTGFNYPLNGPTFDLELVNRSLYVVGGFTTVAGNARGKGAKFFLPDSSLMAFNPGATGGDIYVAKSYRGTLVIGGNFSSIRSVSRTAYLTALDTLVGTKATNWVGKSMTGGYVNSIALSGQTAYAGGTFTTYDGTPRAGLLSFNAANGNLNFGFVADANNIVHDLLSYGSNLYVVGRVNTINNVSRNFLFALDGTTGAVKQFNIDIKGFTYDLNLVDNRLYISGEFGIVGNYARYNLTSCITQNVPLDITGFSPSTAPAGTTINLVGTGFSNVNRVTFGGVDATSFTVVNDVSISAVVGSGNSGYVAVYSGSGQDSIAGFSMCPTTVPVINQDTVYACSTSNGARVSAQPGYDFYLWSNGTSSSSPNTNITTSGSFTVRGVIGACTTTASAPVRVFIVSPPARPRIMVSPDSNLCGNSTAKLTVRDSLPGMQFLWNQGSRTRSIQAAPNGVYAVQVVYAGCTTAFSANVNTRLKATPPTIRNLFVNACAGDQPRLIINTGVGNDYWLYDAQNSTTPINIPVLRTNTTLYYELYNQTTGCKSNRAEILVTVNPKPDSSFVLVANNLLKAVDSTTNGNQYQWIRNGRSLPGATSKQYRADSTGNYQLRITNSYGCTTLSQPVLVTIVGLTNTIARLPIKAYPNPGQRYFKVQAQDLFGKAFLIQNPLGQQVQTGTFMEDPVLDLGHLPAGPYLLVVQGYQPIPLELLK